MNRSDLIIVGAGPSGLATAIAAARRDLSYTLLEKGVLVNSIFRFPTHMVFFTTPELLEIGDLPFVTPYEKPTRLEALKHYRRVANHHRLRVEFGHEVVAIRRRGQGDDVGIEVSSRTAAGETCRWYGRAVVLAIGYYDHPNLLGVPGEALPHVRHYYTDAHPFFRQRVVVVGGANSAAEAALELYRNGAADVTLVHRGAELSRHVKYWVRPDILNRLEEGSIRGRLGWSVVRISPGGVCIEAGDGRREDLPADAVFLLTGYHPDHALLQEAGVALAPVTRMPRHDPATFETNVPGLFLVGGAVSGIDTAPVFIENGRLHGERVAETIARRLGR